MGKFAENLYLGKRVLPPPPPPPHFWNMFQISTVQTSSYRSRMINAWSWSIKISEKRPKVRSGCISFFLCFSVTKRLPSIWLSLHDANLKHVSEMHIFQNSTPCQSETCFRMAHVSERHAAYALIAVNEPIMRMVYYIAIGGGLQLEKTWQGELVFTYYRKLKGEVM